MAISSFLSRRRTLLFLRHLSSATTTTSTTFPSCPPSPHLSVSAAKSRLRAEFNPDAALSILSSVADPSASPVSARFAFELAVRRLARSRRFADIEALLEPRKMSPSAAQEPFLATLILSYGSASMLNHAIKTFEDSPAPRTAISFNALLTSCIRSRHPRRVPGLFTELSKKYSIEPDGISYGVLIKSLFLSGKPEKAFEAFKEMEEKGIEPTTVTYTTLLDSLYKEGKAEEAEKLWKEMVVKGCKPDVTAYNVRVMHSALHGKPEDVLGLIAEMEPAGLKPDAITYNYLMTCYYKDGQLAEAKEVYRGLQKKGCSPNASMYRNLLYHLCKNGDFDAGLEVYKDSVKHNKIPDFQTMRLLVEGLAKGSKVETAKEIIAEMKKRFPESLLSGWKKVEKELGLVEDGETSDQVEIAQKSENL